MIDLTNPIRTKDGREAKYLGKLPDCSFVIAWKHRAKEHWDVDAFSKAHCTLEFENIPPEPPKLTGYIPLGVPSSPVFPVCDSMTYHQQQHSDADWAIDLSTLTAANFVQVRG